MITLRVIIDQMLAPEPGGIGRYTHELTRELIRTAPAHCSVEGIVSASPETDYARVDELLPGLSGLFKSALARRDLMAAWQHGFTRLPGHGMIHATSLLAPLSRHDRLNNAGDQIAVTVHDVVPWTNPEQLSSRSVAWHTAMARRAQRFADAVVVPTHAVAEELVELFDFGDRVRVIGGAPASGLLVGDDEQDRAERLDLPAQYVLSAGTAHRRKALVPLITAMEQPELADVPLLVAGIDDGELRELALAAGLDPDRARGLGYLHDADLAVALNRSHAFAFPSTAEGFGLPLVEAMHFGLPIVHSDAPALVEVAGGAGLAVEREGGEPYSERLADALTRVVTDSKLRDRLRVLARDRARAFTWASSAEKVWQLHADL